MPFRNDEQKTRPRRRFLARTAFGALAVAASGLLYAMARSLLPNAKRLRRIRVGRPGDFLPGAWQEKQEESIFVFATDRGVAALRARCTHLGCALDRVGERFVCPCHGSEFDDEGRVLSPPAKRGLRWLRVTVTRHAVYVDPDQEVAANTFAPVPGGRHA